MSEQATTSGDQSLRDVAVRRLAATPRLLVALDFDGTLSTLRDNPSEVRMLAAARTAVTNLAALHDTTVAFISGRGLADLMMVSEHTPGAVFHLVGSHGSEYWHPDAPEHDAPVTQQPDAGAAKTAESRLRVTLEAAARDAVTDIEGAWIESKPFGFALHTRLAGSLAHTAQECIERLMDERAPDWRKRAGHNLIEYASRHEGKDTALRLLRERTGATAVLYAGDDVTDEDALASLSGDDFGIRIGAASTETSASLRVADPSTLIELLNELTHRRTAY